MQNFTWNLNATVKAKEKKKGEKKNYTIMYIAFIRNQCVTLFDEHNVFTNLNLRNIFHVLLALWKSLKSMFKEILVENHIKHILICFSLIKEKYQNNEGRFASYEQALIIQFGWEFT